VLSSHAQTASEPLSLEEEHAMQRSWLEDDNKCTFIVLDSSRLPTDRTATQEEEIAAMIGDVNIFLNDADDAHVGEIEVMIAETHARGRGCGAWPLPSIRMCTLYESFI
jgi:hypothetical protein